MPFLPSQCSVFWGMSYLQMASLLTQRKWEKCIISLFHQTRMSSIHFWAWPPIIGTFKMDKCQKAFDLLKVHLTSTPVLGYPDFSHHFNLETHASLQGLGAGPTQRDKHSQTRIIAYASLSLHPNEKKMRNYSLAKLEFIVLKWAMTEKLWDYLLGSKFTMYTDNNPLALCHGEQARGS